MVASNNDDNTVYVLATALYFSEDNHDKTLLIVGRLSEDAELLIKKDLQVRLPETALSVKVVPAFQNIYEIPVHTNLWDHMRAKYHNNILIISNLTAVQSRRIMKHMDKRILMYKSRKQNEENPTHKTDEGNTETDYFTENVTLPYDGNTTILHTTPHEPSHSGGNPETTTDYDQFARFVPNDIYYAVEKRCANWADGCESNDGSIFGQPSIYYHVPKIKYKFPHKLRWVP